MTIAVALDTSNAFNTILWRWVVEALRAPSSCAFLLSRSHRRLLLGQVVGIPRQIGLSVQPLAMVRRCLPYNILFKLPCGLLRR